MSDQEKPPSTARSAAGMVEPLSAVIPDRPGEVPTDRPSDAIVQRAAGCPAISLIVPARDEEKLLPALLDSVAAAREQFAGGPAQIEVIIADNRSTDCTAAIGAARGCVLVSTDSTTIGGVRNAGALVAHADILVFVDADTVLHPGTFNAIHAALDDRTIVAGATGVRLDRFSFGIAATWAMMIPMVWLTGLDTGAVFCRWADFTAIGGYDETLPFAEDVKLLWTLRVLGRSRGQHLTRLGVVKAIASTRKFDRYGDWHYFGLAARAARRFILRRRREDRALHDYWYGRRD